MLINKTKQGKYSKNDSNNFQDKILVLSFNTNAAYT